MVDNSSSMAFKRMLEEGPISILMQDYASMEKVGMLGRTLPSNNQRIVAQPGDIILYMGNAIVVYYDSNTYNFTRLGHIEGVTQDELKAVLGKTGVEMTFELTE